MTDFLFLQKYSPKETGILEKGIEINVQEMHKDYSIHRKYTNDLRIREACSVPLLGQILVRVVVVLSEHTSAEYRTVIELPVMEVLNAGTDGVIVVINAMSARPVPVVIYEYKPKVHTTMPNTRDIVELLIQGYYCFKKFHVQACILFD